MSRIILLVSIFFTGSFAQASSYAEDLFSQAPSAAFENSSKYKFCTGSGLKFYILEDTKDFFFEDRDFVHLAKDSDKDGVYTLMGMNSKDLNAIVGPETEASKDLILKAYADGLKNTMLIMALGMVGPSSDGEKLWNEFKDEIILNKIRENPYSKEQLWNELLSYPKDAIPAIKDLANTRFKILSEMPEEVELEFQKGSEIEHATVKCRTE